MDPLETQNFRVIAQLAEGGCAGVALETERPERLLESEGVGYAVCRHPQRVGVCLQMLQFLWCKFLLRAHTARIIKTISKGVVLIISPFLKKLYCRSSYLLYNQNKHCGFVFHKLRLRLVGGDSNRSDLSELVISWVTLDVSFA